MNVASSCWICGSEKVDRWKPGQIERTLSAEDLKITDKRYGLTLDLLKCRDCGFIFAHNADVENLTRLYSDLDDPGYEDSLASRRLQMSRLLDRVLRLRPAARSMLDVGAGVGLLVHECRARGFHSVGIELSRALVDAGRKYLGVDLIQGTFPHPDLTGQKFDLIFLVDVIEHVANPLALMRSCRDALNPEGALILVTPDVRSLAARIFGRKWWHFRLAHVGYFDRRSIEIAAHKSGLRCERLFRACWYFQIDYLGERLANYLPVSWLNRLARRFAVTRWLYQRTVPLNLLDSWVAVLVPNMEDRKS